jgi:hypothetical protein
VTLICSVTVKRWLIIIVIIIAVHRERWWRQLQSYICEALLCELKWLTSPILVWKALSQIVHKWSVFMAWVLVSLFFLITRLTCASVFLSSSARRAPNVMLPRHSRRFWARVSQELTWMLRIFSDTFRESLKRFFWPPAWRFPLLSSPYSSCYCLRDYLDNKWHAFVALPQEMK